MSLHPTITAALADQHRRDLMSQASARRLARTARQGSLRQGSLRQGSLRQGSFRNPARRPLIVRALRTAAAATAIAATAFLVTLAGPSHAPSAHGNWGAHYRIHVFGAVTHSSVHHYQGNVRFASHRFTTRWAS